MLYWPVKFDFIGYHLSKLTKIISTSHVTLDYKMLLFNSKAIKQY
mgnify:CR=1 FL=1